MELALNGWPSASISSVVLLSIEFLASLVMGWINPVQDFGVMLHPIITLSVAIILFEGRLNQILQWHEYREVSIDVSRLAGINLP